MKTVTAEFRQTSGTLGHSYRGAVEQARQAIERIETSIDRAAESAGNAAGGFRSRSAANIAGPFMRCRIWLPRHFVFDGSRCLQAQLTMAARHTLMRRFALDIWPLTVTDGPYFDLSS